MNLKHTFQMFRQNRKEKKLLQEINAGLPTKIDWKKGAREYLSKIINDPDGHNRRFELIKPFLPGPDLGPFTTDIYTFVNLVEKLNLPPGARILDVGCGAGWCSHYLAKLGYSVTGLDISQELLDVARERITTDPYPPSESERFHIDFHLVDIEASEFKVSEPFDCVLFMSALHHFLNPIRAIAHATQALKPEGLLGIVEASAPDPDSSYEKTNQEIMEKYHTLERPYTRDQIQTILNLTGFRFFRCYQPVNGLFLPRQTVIHSVNQQILEDNWNIVIASRTHGQLPKTDDDQRLPYENGYISFRKGVFDAETDPELGPFHWMGPDALMVTTGVTNIKLTLQTIFMDPELSQIKVFVSRDGTIDQHLVFTRDNATIELEYSDLNNETQFGFMSDHVFRPDWYDLDDTRMLAVKLKIEERVAQ